MRRPVIRRWRATCPDGRTWYVYASCEREVVERLVPFVPDSSDLVATRVELAPSLDDKPVKISGRAS